MNSQPQLDSDLRLSCEVLNERIIANGLIEHGTQRTWPNSRHLAYVLCPDCSWIKAKPDAIEATKGSEYSLRGEEDFYETVDRTL